mmetsp:Transcript_21751/g.40505  ORF Transcript_21751/g.40505 Transcript_21751/m.40505 type:complete len:209 (-) Transcript_21751:209-835(-)
MTLGEPGLNACESRVGAHPGQLAAGVGDGPGAVTLGPAVGVDFKHIDRFAGTGLDRVAPQAGDAGHQIGRHRPAAERRHLRGFESWVICALVHVSIFAAPFGGRQSRKPRRRWASVGAGAGFRCRRAGAGAGQLPGRGIASGGPVLRASAQCLLASDDGAAGRGRPAGAALCAEAAGLAGPWRGSVGCGRVLRARRQPGRGHRVGRAE